MGTPQPNGGFEWAQAPWGAVLPCVPLGAAAGHFFTVANLRLTGDPSEWQQVAGEIGVPPDALRLIRQVHGVDVSVVHAGSAGTPDRPTADIVITADAAVAVGVRVADCAPVLIADRSRGAVGAVHAGWRGTLHSAAAVAVRAMERSFGSRPEDLIAAVGPCLGPCCGKVGPEVVEEFRAAGHSAPDLARWFTAGPTPRPYLNLWAANRDQLERAGVPPPQIHVAEICTKTHPTLLHSYRAHGARAGRMVALIRARA
jgi:polyphenol oxidase